MLHSFELSPLVLRAFCCTVRVFRKVCAYIGNCSYNVYIHATLYCYGVCMCCKLGELASILYIVTAHV